MRHSPVLRIVLVADGRSPTTRSWMAGLLKQGVEIHLISTYPTERPADCASFAVLPVAFSQYSTWQTTKNISMKEQSSPPSIFRRLLKKLLAGVINRFRSLILIARHKLGPFTLFYYARHYQHLIRQIQPDIVHALRIPYEGMLASFTPPEFPFVVSTWGNDLTFHAKGSRWMGKLTRRTLQRAAGLLSDTQRDVHLARDWGLASCASVGVFPGSGGLDLEAISLAADLPAIVGEWPLPKDRILVVNPRGVRPGSVRTDTFFQSIPFVLTAKPECLFVCPAMAGQAEALYWIRRLNLQRQVVLLPKVSQAELWRLFHSAQVLVSPSQHDGTPNSFLEAIACGCFPVVGDIASLREWVTQGENGWLVPPDDPQALANAILNAIEDENLRSTARKINYQIITTRAERQVVMNQVIEFYRELVYCDGKLLSPTG